MLVRSLVFLVLSSTSLCLPQNADPTSAGTIPDGAGVKVAIPTALGDVGVSPFKWPDPDELAAPVGVDTDFLEEVVKGDSTSVKWIATTTDFGTATITTTQDGKTGQTVVPQGLRVVLNDEGEAEIIISQFLQDEMNKIEDAIKVPRCEPLGKRNLAKRKTVPDCHDERIGPLVFGMVNSDTLMGQMELAVERMMAETGTDETALRESGQMLSLLDADLTHGTLNNAAAGNNEALAAMPSGLGGMTASMAVFWALKGDADNLRKIKSKPIAVPKYPLPPKPDDCPPERELACAGNRCKGVVNVCTGEWQGCPCRGPAGMTADDFFWGPIYEQVMKAFGDFRGGGDIPSASCSAEDGGGNNNVVGVESKTWTQLVDNYCKGKPYLASSFSETKKPADLGVDGSSDWTFDFILEGAEDNACAGYICDDVFGKFKMCTYNSHSAFGSGELKLDCGVAKYRMNDPRGSAKTKLVKQNEKCYNTNQFGEHPDIHGGRIKDYGFQLCHIGKNKIIKAGDSSTNKDAFQSPYQFNTYWRNGCELETGQTEMDFTDPLDTGKPDWYSGCAEIFYDNWNRCDNKGTGGSVQYGCLVYEFKATNKKA